jgi:predicted ABC-type ATPase
MNNQKQLWVLAGGNGGGKTTFYDLQLAKHDIKFVNADSIAKHLNPTNSQSVSYEAATLAAKMREALISHGVSFCFETVFSHESKIDFIAQAKALGYKIVLVYFYLNDPSLHEARVRQRVKDGGHDVPVDKIYSRLPRTTRNIKAALAIVDEARFLDNSLKSDPFKQILVMKNGNYHKMVDPLPEWAEDFLPDRQA